MYSPARTTLRNPYPQWHKFFEILVAQNLRWNPYPYWHKSIKNAILCSITVVKKCCIHTNIENLDNLVQILTWILFLHFALSLAHPLETPYPLWHTYGVQNPTLRGTLPETPNLWGTEICQKYKSLLSSHICTAVNGSMHPPGIGFVSFTAN